MTISHLHLEVKNRHPFLYKVGVIHLSLFVFCFIAFWIDSRTVLGINTWIKPMKFCLSIVIYVWTIAYFLGDLKSKRLTKWLGNTIGIMMLLEITILLVQAGRGVRSHFNMSTELDSILFALMGVMIGINTLIVVIIFFLYMKDNKHLERVYLLAIRISLGIFLIGSLVGGMMIGLDGHAIGVEDGGDGIPFFNWSTKGGDLRIAHFLGLHAIQAIPLFVWLTSKFDKLTQRMRHVKVWLIGIAYLSFIIYLWIRALDGVPILGG